jgi:aminoglycoside 3-N-acetyltransferase
MITPPDGAPRTRATLAADLATLPVRHGDVLLVHSSLRSLGWVCGGAVAVVQALLDVLGPAGTLVVPAQTPYNRDPSLLTDPPLPESWWPVVREHLPGFDPAVTPSETVGVVAERVRTWPGSVRSAHPQSSFAAVGRHAEELMRGHRLDCHLGEESPLARLEEAGARVLLLGVGYDRATAFHLAEYRLPDPPMREYSCAVTTPHGRRWVTYQDISLDDSDFAALGADFERASDTVRAGTVGSANCRLFPLRAAVAFAAGWMGRHRGRPPRGPRVNGASSDTAAEAVDILLVGPDHPAQRALEHGVSLGIGQIRPQGVGE